MRVLPTTLVRTFALATALIGPTVLTALAHESHHPVMPQTTRSVVDYVVPDVQLLRDDGRAVSLRQEMNDGRPVVLNFIYTTCTSVCPLTSRTFSELQTRLGSARDKVHLMSISVDPEQDRPEQLRAYAKAFDAGTEWQHYTGTVAASVASQRAFNVYRGDKMNHVPATLVRVAPGAPWVRIDGFATAGQLLAELTDARVSKE